MSVTASNATAPFSTVRHSAAETQHYGIGDLHKAQELFRVTVGGDVPVSVDGRRRVTKRKETNPALLRAAAE